MAIFGFHVITTLIGASVLSKLVSHFCLTRLIYNGLKRFIVPSDQQLMEDAGHYRLRSKGRKRRSEAQNNANGSSNSGSAADNEFYFPRMVPVQLKETSITYQDVAILPLYSSCQWIVNFSICALGVYAVNEFAYNFIVPLVTEQSKDKRADPDSADATSASINFITHNRLNLSLIWLILTLWFVLRTLTSMTCIYFQSSKSELKSNNTTQNGSAQASSNSSNSSADWRLILSSWFLLFIMSVFLMLLDQRYFDFRLRDAHNNLTWIIVGNLSKTADQTIHISTPLITWGAFQFILAVTAAFIGAFFVYPGLKYSRLYVDAVKSDSLTWSTRMLLHTAFIAPLVPILLWVLPVTRHLSNGLLSLSTRYQYPYLPLLTAMAADLLHEDFLGLASLRTLACLGVVLLRIGTVRWGLQTYLNSCQVKLAGIAREPGRISNREVQRLVASVFHCLNLVALQYLTPAILQLCLACLLKNVMSHPWLPARLQTIGEASAKPGTGAGNFTDLSFVEVFNTATWSLTDLVHARAVFVDLADSLLYRGTLVARGVLNFLAWWSLAVWQMVCLVGLAYHRVVVAVS